MYQYVTGNGIKKYRICCSSILKELKTILYDEHNIDMYYILIGSGAKNMVTRNGNAPYDLDYNIILKSVPYEYYGNSQNLQKLKELIRSELNEINSKLDFSDSKDSTSALTTILHFMDNDQVQFSFDLAILIEDEQGHFHRLIHNKKENSFIWNQVPSSNYCKEKADELKKIKVWNEVRDIYLEKKNMYLKQRDCNHPSFNVYIETINEIYYKYFE